MLSLVLYKGNSTHADDQGVHPLSLFYRLLFCLNAVFSLGNAAPAQEGKDARYYVPAIPDDLEQVDFYLITGGVGDEVANRFGHTGLRVLDRVNRMDVVFNWGKFSFNQPGFLWKFFRGSLTYSMGVRTFAADKEHYRSDERRLVMETLNLTLAQKRRLLEKIAWNAVPEHRDFAYQYWYKNCATIPRDYLDEVLDGQVRAHFAAAPTNKSFRHYMRRGLQAVPFVASSLDVLMNANIDRKISAWEEMFLPEFLHAHLAEMPAIDDDGNPVPGKRLLGETVVLSDYEDSFARPFNDYLLLAACGGLPLLLALGLFLARRRELLSLRLFGLSSVLWGLVSGVFGLTLLINWMASGHPDGWANANVLLFSPLDFYLVPVGWALLRTGAPVKDRLGFLHAGKILAACRIASVVVLVGLAAGGVITQDIWRVAAWFGTVTVALYASVAVFCFDAAVAPVGALAAQTQESGGRILTVG